MHGEGDLGFVAMDDFQLSVLDEAEIGDCPTLPTPSTTTTSLPPTSSSCGGEGFQCKVHLPNCDVFKDGPCLGPQQVCDFIHNCADGGDEANCPVDNSFEVARGLYVNCPGLCNYGQVFLD